MLSADTYQGDITDPLSLNLYTYCNNEPMMNWDPTGHDSVPVTVYLPGGGSYTTTAVNGVTQTGNHGALPVGAVVQTSSGASWQVQQTDQGKRGVPVATVPVVIPATGGSTVSTVATVDDGHAYALNGSPMTDYNGAVVYTAGGTYKVEGGVGVLISKGSTGSTGSTSPGNQKETNEFKEVTGIDISLYEETRTINVNDILQGMFLAIDENLTDGFIKSIATGLLNRNYSYTSEYDYYTGRVIGDAISMLVGAGLTAEGLYAIIAAIVGGGAATVFTGGAASIVAGPVSVTAVVGGAAVITYGGIVLQASASGLGGDINGLSENYASRNWNKGRDGSPREALTKHYDKHGAEVGAYDEADYASKAENFKKNLKGARSFKVDGYTSGIYRWVKNGKYIDLAPDGTIISFGKWIKR